MWECVSWFIVASVCVLDASVEEGNDGIDFGGLQLFAGMLAGAVSGAAASVMEYAAVVVGEPEGVEHLVGVGASKCQPFCGGIAPVGGGTVFQKVWKLG